MLDRLFINHIHFELFILYSKFIAVDSFFSIFYLQWVKMINWFM